MKIDITTNGQLIAHCCFTGYGEQQTYENYVKYYNKSKQKKKRLRNH